MCGWAQIESSCFVVELSVTLIMNISQIWAIYVNFSFSAIWYLQLRQWKGLKCLHSPQWFQTKVSGEAQSSMLFQKCSFCHFKWKSATEEMKWDITVCWQQWLWLFHCSICLVFDNEIEVVLRDSPVYRLEPIWQVESGAIVRGVLVELQ